MPIIDEMLNKEIDSVEEKHDYAEYAIEDKPITQKTAIVSTLIKAAKKGDVKAALYLMDHSETTKDIVKDTKLEEMQKRKKKRSKKQK